MGIDPKFSERTADDLFRNKYIKYGLRSLDGILNGSWVYALSGGLSMIRLLHNL